MSPRGYSEAFVSLFAPLYPGLEALQARTHFYMGTFALQEALWGIEHNDQEAFESGIALCR
jgi:aminoglycoside 2''-phosphotransferase